MSKSTTVQPHTSTFSFSVSPSATKLTALLVIHELCLVYVFDSGQPGSIPDVLSMCDLRDYINRVLPALTETLTSG
jgi:hypothetical protein